MNFPLVNLSQNWPCSVSRRERLTSPKMPVGTANSLPNSLQRKYGALVVRDGTGVPPQGTAASSRGKIGQLRLPYHLWNGRNAGFLFFRLLLEKDLPNGHD
jgi:hypothetical protein